MKQRCRKWLMYHMLYLLNLKNIGNELYYIKTQSKCCCYFIHFGSDTVLFGNRGTFSVCPTLKQIRQQPQHNIAYPTAYKEKTEMNTSMCPSNQMYTNLLMCTQGSGIISFQRWSIDKYLIFQYFQYFQFIINFFVFMIYCILAQLCSMYSPMCIGLSLHQGVRNSDEGVSRYMLMYLFIFLIAWPTH